MGGVEQELDRVMLLQAEGKVGYTFTEGWEGHSRDTSLSSGWAQLHSGSQALFSVSLVTLSFCCWLLFS